MKITTPIQSNEFINNHYDYESALLNNNAGGKNQKWKKKARELKPDTQNNQIPKAGITVEVVSKEL